MNQSNQKISENAEVRPGPATETVVADWPALDVVRRTGAFGKLPKLTAVDRLGQLYQSRNHGELVREFHIGSVVSYAMENGDCPIRAIERAQGFGHELHWITEAAVSITSHKRAKRRLVLIEAGMLVEFEGRVFLIEPKRNGGGRLGLTQVSDNAYMYGIEAKKAKA